MKCAIGCHISFVLLAVVFLGSSQHSSAASARTPVLLELFTSEGCSSCPPADRVLQSLDKLQPVPGAELVVLSEHVDYWNHGGWSDPYSSPIFSQRQTDYAKGFGSDDIYTPQLVVDGTTQLVGSNEGAARSAIAKALTRSKFAIELSNAVRAGDHISVHIALPAPSRQDVKHAAIYLAIADNEDRSQVVRGENAGRSLNHVAVVRTLLSVGPIGSEGLSKDLSVPFKSDHSSGIRIVLFVQDQRSHAILAVTQTRL